MYNNILWDLGLLDESFGRAFGQWDGLKPIWGCFVYRVTNNNQAPFDEYIEYVQKAVKTSLIEEVEEEREWASELADDDEEIWTYEALAKVTDNFHLCVREGQHLVGLSVEQVQDVHDQWTKELEDASEEYYLGLPGCLTEHLERSSNKRQIRVPRFGYFMYVDDKVLQKFQETRSACGVDSMASFKTQREHGVFAQIIQAKQEGPTDSDLEDRAGEPDEDDDKLWQYVHVFCLPILYDALYQSNCAWYGKFVRPPGINTVGYGEL